MQGQRHAVARVFVRIVIKHKRDSERRQHFRSRFILTRAPLGYFYNAPHWGGGGGLFQAPL